MKKALTGRHRLFFIQYLIHPTTRTSRSLNSVLNYFHKCHVVNLKLISDADYGNETELGNK